MDGRQFPVRLMPLPGESLDSWLRAYSGLVSAPVRYVLEGTVGTQKNALTPWSVAVRGLPNLSDLEARIGFPAGALDSLVRPLREYERAAKEVGTTATRSLVGLLQSSRFCPACLASGDGRWMRSWRWAWNASCPTHGTLLAAKCPACGSGQRPSRMNRTTSLEDPWTCANHVLRAPAYVRERCNFDLRTVVSRRADEAVVSYCADLVRRLENASASGDYGPVLQDVDDLLAVIDATVSLDGGPPVSAMRDSPKHLAQTLAKALPALQDSSGPALLRLIKPTKEQRATRVLPPRWWRASPRLVEPATAARLEVARPVERLRWAGALGGARPSDGEDVARELAQRLPASLWPGCAMKLMPREVDSTRTVFRPSMVVALLVPGSQLSSSELCAAAPFTGVDAAMLARCVGFLTRANPTGAAIKDLAELAATLRASPPPIDYARRRQFASSTEMLTSSEWERICTSARDFTGGPPRHRMASVWIWEEVTGGTFREASITLGREVSGFEAPYFAFIRLMRPALRDELRRHARSILERNGIFDEPLTWEPALAERPSSLGPLPADQQRAHRELVKRLPSRESLGVIGRDLGLNSEQIKCLVRSGSFLTEHDSRPGAPVFLAEADLRQLIEVERLSVRETAQILGVDRKTISARSSTLGIALNGDALRRTIHVSDRWLHDQYVVRKRTLGDLANELGCGETTIAHALRDAGIGARPRGGGSHALRLLDPSGLPPLLARACRGGPEGVERIRRFAVVANARSMGEAARQLGVTQSTLSLQIRHLERDVGGVLLVRLSPGHIPQEVTPLGLRLLTLASGALEEVPPRPRIPEPLRSALRIDGGQRRLGRLSTLMASETWTDAGVSIGLSAISTRGFVRSCEESLGFQLFERHQGNDSLRPTARCGALLRQADAWERAAS